MPQLLSMFPGPADAPQFEPTAPCRSTLPFLHAQARPHHASMLPMFPGPFACRFPSVCPALFCCVYSSRLFLSRAPHPAVPFRSGCSHSSPCHCPHHCLPLFSHYVIIPTSKKSNLVASSPSPHPALLFSPSSCSFNRILTCPSSNPRGICEVGCHQFFFLSSSESFGIWLTGTVNNSAFKVGRRCIA